MEVFGEPGDLGFDGQVQEVVFEGVGFEEFVEGELEGLGAFAFVFGPDEFLDASLDLALAALDGPLVVSAGALGVFTQGALGVAFQAQLQGGGLADGARDAMEGGGELRPVVGRLGFHGVLLDARGELQAELEQLAETGLDVHVARHEQK